MTCATCGTVGSAGATWCPQCFMPYVRAGATPAAYQPPTLAAPGYAPSYAPAVNTFAPQAYPPPPMYSAPAYVPPAYAPPVGYPQQYAEPVWPAKLGLVVPEIAVQTGDLPRICVVSGVPTDNMVKMRWMWAPSWTLLLGLLIRYLIADKSAGYLPIHPSIRRKRALLVWSGFAGFFVGISLIVAGSATNSPVLPLLGILTWIGSIVSVVRGSRLNPPVRRAAPGYLALPKASAEFASAFRAGRPAGQVPYSATPMTFRTRKAFAVLGVICASIIVPVAVIGVVVQHHECSAAVVHPNVTAVDAEFTVSKSIVAQINGENGGQGLTQASAQQLLAEHARLISQVQTLSLSTADRAAVDSYAQSLQSYDNALTAAMQQQDAAGDAALSQAAGELSSAGMSLSAALHSTSTDCTND